MKHLVLCAVFALALPGVARAEAVYLKNEDGSFAIDPPKLYEFLHKAYSSKRVADNAYDVLINKRRGNCYDAVVHVLRYFDDGPGNVPKYCYRPDLASDDAVTDEPQGLRAP
ncbi:MULTISPECIES: hypothetical protein [Acetobacteraceae]|nr:MULTISPECIES: hypothetical protein [Acetobacteraceae]MCQ0042351.1 hypothetical protein [Bombella sp.]MUG78891.1 hypothetical protein [Bombella sp. ESL0380]MUH02209.1 hypothetical protein [Bombella sp. ESL0387]QGT74634.1 hypothetical protein GN304_01850 [Bombella sp. ESL0368]MBE1724178.1 hypothetical protein [Bombella apis]